MASRSIGQTSTHTVQPLWAMHLSSSTVTGALLRREGAVETLGLLDTDTTVPGLGRVDGQVWRDRLTSSGRLDGLERQLRMVEESRIATLIPGDAQWPRALDDLGERAPVSYTHLRAHETS